MSSVRDLSQSLIITKLNRFIQFRYGGQTDFLLNKDGICAGLTALYLLNKAKGTEDAFFEKLNKIILLADDDFKTNQSWLADFCKEVTAAFSPEKYQHYVVQGDLDKIFADESADIRKTFVCEIDIAEEDIHTTLISAIHDEEMVYLGANKHAIGVYKRGESYFLYDSNYYDAEFKITDPLELTNKIKEKLQIGSDITQWEIKSFSYNKPPSAASFPSKLELLNKIPSYSNRIYRIMKVACKNNDVEMLEAILEHKASYDRKLTSNSEIFDFIRHPETFVLILKYTKLTEASVIAHLNQSLSHGKTEISNMLFAYGETTYPGFTNKIIKEAFLNASYSSNVDTLLSVVNKDANHQLDDLTIGANAFFKAQHYETLKFLIQKYPALLQDKKVLIEKRNSSIYIAKSNPVFQLLKPYTPEITDHEINLCIGSDAFIFSNVLASFSHTLSWDWIKKLITSCNSTKTALLTVALQDKAKFNPQHLVLFEALKSAWEDQKEMDLSVITQAMSETDLTDLLLMAIDAKKITLVKSLHQHGVQIPSNRHNDYARKLVKACEHGNKAEIQTLEAAGFDLRATGNQLLITLSPHPHIILYLLQQGILTNEKIHEKLAVRTCRDTSQYSLSILQELKLRGFHFKLKDYPYTLLDYVWIDQYRTPKEKINLIQFLLSENVSAFSFYIEEILAFAIQNNHAGLLTSLLKSHPALLQKINLADACKNGKAECVNVLLTYGLQFANDEDDVALLKQAYSDLQADAETSDIQELATAHQHSAIYDYLAIKNKFDLTSQSRFSFFNKDIFSQYIHACKKQNLTLIRHLLRFHHKQISASPQDALLVAATIANAPIISYVLEQYQFNDMVLTTKLADACKAKLFSAAANILECLPDLSPNMEEALLPYQKEIKTALIETFSDSSQEADQISARSLALAMETNALGKLLHANDSTYVTNQFTATSYVKGA